MANNWDWPAWGGETYWQLIKINTKKANHHEVARATRKGFVEASNVINRTSASLLVKRPRWGSFLLWYGWNCWDEIFSFTSFNRAALKRDLWWKKKDMFALCYDFVQLTLQVWIVFSQQVNEKNLFNALRCEPFKVIYFPLIFYRWNQSSSTKKCWSIFSFTFLFFL